MRGRGLKYARLYSDILQALKERTLDGCGFSVEGNLTAVSAVRTKPLGQVGQGRGKGGGWGGARERKRLT